MQYNVINQRIIMYLCQKYTDKIIVQVINRLSLLTSTPAGGNNMSFIKKYMVLIIYYTISCFIISLYYHIIYVFVCLVFLSTQNKINKCHLQ